MARGKVRPVVQEKVLMDMHPWLLSGLRGGDFRGEVGIEVRAQPAPRLSGARFASAHALGYYRAFRSASCKHQDRRCLARRGGLWPRRRVLPLPLVGSLRRSSGLSHAFS